MSYERTSEQRMEALGKANNTRTQRARLKDELKSGDRSITKVIEEPPEYAANMKVSEVLAAMKGFGSVKVGKLMGLCKISTNKRLSGLSPRQRAELVTELRRDRSHQRSVQTPVMITAPASAMMTHDTRV